MDPLTHTLASYALSRAASKQPSLRLTLLFLTAGLAPDLDELAKLGGVMSGLSYSRAVTHSLVGAGVVALLLAVAFWRIGPGRSTAPISFLRALGASALATGAHLFLDATTSRGEALLWPFRQTRAAWDLMLEVEPLLLAPLLICLLLPLLFRLITEEIGAKSSSGAGRGWAVIALAAVLLYGGARFLLHTRAVAALEANSYHGRAPLHAGAFPSSAWPLHWRGVVETETTIEDLDVSLGSGDGVQPDRARTHYKPEGSLLLEAVRSTPTAQFYLRLARFPAASIERKIEGYRAELREIGYSPLRSRESVCTGVFEMSEEGKVLREGLRCERTR
jgi:inner membrane protein